jgi:hypothetical protein
MQEKRGLKIIFENGGDLFLLRGENLSRAKGS